MNGRADRLSCEVAIWLEVVTGHGLSSMCAQRSENIIIPGPIELARRAGLPIRLLTRTYDALRSVSIISFRQRHLNGYILKRPAAFLRRVSTIISRRAGVGKAYSLPPYLRGKPAPELVAIVDAILAPKSLGALAALHSAFLLAGEPIKAGRIYAGQAPLTFLLRPEALNLVVEEMPLSRISPSPSLDGTAKTHLLRLPKGHASADVVLFERKASMAMPVDIPGGPSGKEGGVDQLHPYLNALLLTLYPLRGEEAAERLLEVISKGWRTHNHVVQLPDSKDALTAKDKQGYPMGEGKPK